MNTVAPVASGTNEVGETLSVTTGTWTGVPVPTFTYQWRRDGVSIGAATASTYLLVSDDAETDVDCVVTATNTAGQATADSNDITIAAEGDGSLLDVIASAVFDLDATQAASYGGSGTTWANLVSVPADGETQTKYDLFRGDGVDSANFPAFTGSAGSAAAYWLHDGTDFFKSVDTSSIGATILNAPKDPGTDFWFAFAFRYVDSGSAQFLFSTRVTDGIALNVNTSDELVLTLDAGTGTPAVTFGTLVGGTDYLIIISHNDATNTLRYWINTATASTTTITKAGTNSAGVTYWGVGANPLAGSDVANGTRFYGVYGGNEYLDNTKAGLIIAALEARHSRDYTP